MCHLLFLNTIAYYFTSLSPGDGGGPPFHEREEKAFPAHCVVMSQETVCAAHCIASPNPTKFHFALLQKLLGPVSRQLGNRHCPGDGRARLSGPRGAFLRQANLRASSICAALPSPNDMSRSGAEGTRHRAPRSAQPCALEARSAQSGGRAAGSGLSPFASNFTARKLHTLALGRDSSEMAKPASHEGGEQ